MLEERVVGSPLGWCAEEVPSPWISGPSFPVPLLDRVGRIREDDVKRPKSILINEPRRRQSVAALNFRILDTVQHEVHARDGRRHVVPLLPKQLERPMLAALALHLG